MPPPPRQQFPPFLWLIVAGLVVVTALGLFSNGGGGGGSDVIPYSQFQQYLGGNKVKQVTVAGNVIHGTLTEAMPDGKTEFTTVQVPPDLATQLAQHNVEFSGTATDGGALGTLLSWILPPLLFVGIWMFASRAMMGGRGGGFGGGLLSVGRSRAKLVAETDVKVTFNDVAGVDEAKEELHEIIDFLKRPEEFTRLGAHIPRGILLVGPPGTGKTLLARAVAGEAGVPFYSTNGAEFVEMFVGVGAARVRDLFEQARKTSPCIIFIDELDALGRARGVSPVAGQDEKEQTLNQLLAEMDGFDRSVAIVILAATNRPEILDPALLRAGRFDRQVLVDRPDKKGRVDILRIHLKNLKLAEDVRLEEIAALTPGFTGADLANLANEAAVLATRRGAELIAESDFTGAVERIVAGLEKKSRILIPRERRVVAYHEMGHALVALAIPGSDPVQKVSIIPRGIGALGYTLQRPTDDQVPDGQAGAGRQDDRADGRPGGGDLAGRGYFDWRSRRPGEGDGHRARDGAAIRHGRPAGSGGLGYRAGAVFESAGRILAASAIFRRDGARDRCGGAIASGGCVGAGRGHPDGEPGRAGRGRDGAAGA